MTSVSAIRGVSLPITVDEAVNALVRARRVNGALYVSLPMLFPDGSPVTVRIDESGGAIRASDAGFAYRQVENVGAVRAFRRTAKRFAEHCGVEVGERAIFVNADIATIERAICDVAEASWRTVTTIFDKVSDDEEEVTLSVELQARLQRIFGEERVHVGESVYGSSTTAWEMSAVVSLDGIRSVFQAVGAHPNSINRASTAFRDIGSLPDSPRLIAFVRDRASMGTRLSLLAPAKVIEEAQPDDLLARLAA